MKRSPLPSYIRHKKTGRARAVWTDAAGDRHDKLLPGKFESAESRSAYAKLVAETACPAPVEAVETRTVNDVLLAFLLHGEEYYVGRDGRTTKELLHIKAVARVVREMYGESPAALFGPLALRAIRQRLIDGDGSKVKKRSRQHVNHQVERVKRIWKWAVSVQLATVAQYDSLRTVTGLRKGKTTAPEAKAVQPVKEVVVRATLPFLPAHVRTIVELMLYTGMRPGEACGMTLNQIDRTGKTWVYRPTEHKTAHDDRERIIPFGPKAKAALLAHLAAGRTLDPMAPIFSPRRAAEERAARLRNARKSKVYPSSSSRRAKRRKRPPRECYTTGTVGHAVRVAAVKAKVEHWHPYQLRHAHGTAARNAFGLEAAGATLGHTHMSATEIYAKRNEELALKVAAKLG